MTKKRRVVTEFERRQRDLPHWELPGAVYAIRFSLSARAGLNLTDPQSAAILVQVLHHDDGTRYDLHAYVLMPDHVHVVLRPLPRGPGTVPLSEITKTLKAVSARKINAALGRRGSVWRDESYDRLIRDRREYDGTIRYLEANPVRAGLVERADQWPWAWPPSPGSGR